MISAEDRLTPLETYALVRVLKPYEADRTESGLHVPESVKTTFAVVELLKVGAGTNLPDGHPLVRHTNHLTPGKYYLANPTAGKWVSLVHKILLIDVQHITAEYHMSEMDKEAS